MATAYQPDTTFAAYPNLPHTPARAFELLNVNASCSQENDHEDILIREWIRDLHFGRGGTSG